GTPGRPLDDGEFRGETTTGKVASETRVAVGVLVVMGVLVAVGVNVFVAVAVLVGLFVTVAVLVTVGVLVADPKIVVVAEPVLLAGLGSGSVAVPLAVFVMVAPVSDACGCTTIVMVALLLGSNVAILQVMS